MAQPSEHCIRVVTSRETSGEGWLKLRDWMREWAGRADLYLVHVDQVDLLGLQAVLARMEHCLAQGATNIVVDLGVANVSPTAMLSLFAERGHLAEHGVTVTLRGRSNLRGGPGVPAKHACGRWPLWRERRCPGIPCCRFCCPSGRFGRSRSPWQSTHCGLRSG